MPDAWLDTGEGRRYVLTGANSWTVGRNPDCTVVLESRAVSRLHALVECLEGGEYYLIDLGSRNGSYVNNYRVTTPVQLKDGDRMSFGDRYAIFRRTDQRNTEQISRIREGATTAILQRVLTVSVLVIDIRDYTPLARKIDETLLSQTIGTWFKSAGGIVQRYGSWAQRYIGDAVMSVWLHEQPHRKQEQIQAILQAAIELSEITAQLQHAFSLPQTMRIGAGINTGEAMVGNSDYTALGDTVNAAFRLESATKQIGADIALGHSTFQELGLTPSAPACFQQQQVALKGYDQPTIAWAAEFHQLRGFLPGRTL